MWPTALAFFVSLSAARAAPEVCNGADDDDDGATDEAPLAWFADADLDGSGDPAVVQITPDCVAPAGWVADSLDCHDGRDDVEPGAIEDLDGLDNDCDGGIDEDAVEPLGCDRLTYGDSVYLACQDDTDWSTASSSCASWGYHLVTMNDSGENTYFADTLFDNNEYYWWIGLWDSTQTNTFVWEDGDPSSYRNWYTNQPNGSGDDCTDTREYWSYWNNRSCNDPLPYLCESECLLRFTYPDGDQDGFGDPGGEELDCGLPGGRVYNGLDCDDGDPDLTVQIWFADEDEDGYGDPSTMTVQCGAPDGYVSDGGDCEDGDPLRHPETEWHDDEDGDGYGAAEVVGVGCEALGEVYDGSDCDDTSGSIHPDAQEVCGGADEDCDTLVDDADPDVAGQQTWFSDTDGDGYGTGGAQQTCAPPAQSAPEGGDCDDEDEFTHPLAAELCDELDNDCDEAVDEDVVDLTWYPDADGDGYGVDGSGQEVTDCVPPGAGWASQAGDCDDAEPSTHPGADDVDGDDLDQDCDGSDGPGSPSTGDRELSEPDPVVETVGCGCAQGPGAGGLVWLALALVVACKRQSPPHSSPPSEAPRSETQPPGGPPPANLLVLLLDDTGQDKVSIYGVHPDAPQTPHIDALAEQGMRFTQAWSHPMCSPTRAALLTGQHTRRYGIGDRLTPNVTSWELVAGSVLTLPQMLASSPWPWDTSHVGKWHLSAGNLGVDAAHHPGHHGFAWSEGTLANLYAALTTTVPAEERDYFQWEEIRNGEIDWKQGYVTSEVVDDALARATQMQEPWLMWVALHSAHDPLHVPPPELYSGPEPQNDIETMDAMVSAMDAEIGRLIAQLPPDLLARTNLVLLSDNGTPSHGIAPPLDPGRAKSSVYEGGVRVPFIVAGPAVAQPGSVTDALVSVVDLMPTLAELAGIDVSQLPTELDGQSLLPILADPDEPGHELLYADFFVPNGPGPYSFTATSVRDADYKYVRTEEDAGVLEELFHVSPDSLDEGEDLLRDAAALTDEDLSAWERLRDALLETREHLSP